MKDSHTTLYFSQIAASVSCLGEQEGDVFSKAKEEESISTVGAVAKILEYTQW